MKTQNKQPTYRIGIYFNEWLAELATPYNPEASASTVIVPCEVIAEAGFPKSYLEDFGWDYNAETDCYELSEFVAEMLGE